MPSERARHAAPRGLLLMFAPIDQIDPLETAEAWRRLTTNPTRDERIAIYYRGFAGEFPAPIRSALALMLAIRCADLEDQEGLQ